jgi:hypothetical protein
MQDFNSLLMRLCYLIFKKIINSVKTISKLLEKLNAGYKLLYFQMIKFGGINVKMYNFATHLNSLNQIDITSPILTFGIIFTIILILIGITSKNNNNSFF